jgi:type 1 glutamine amidotransferase
MPSRAPFRILVFSKTSGYRHASIPAGIAAIRALASRNNLFTVDASEEAALAITASSLRQYQVIVLLQCTGDFLDEAQTVALQNFVRAGGGVVAIHGAAAGMLRDDWYGALVGAHFDMHPDPELGRVIVEDAKHPICNGCASRESWKDEWYNFTTHPRNNAELKVLLRGDTASFTGGKMGDDHPLAWCQEFEGGRAWFTALGHFDEAYVDEWFMEQILRACLWVARKDELLDGHEI